MFGISELMWLGLIGLSCAYWWRAAGVKETALTATKAYCQQADVQLLDDALVLYRFWFKKDETGMLRVWRSYVFEFASTGEYRYNGQIILLGNKVLSIQLEPHQV